MEARNEENALMRKQNLKFFRPLAIKLNGQSNRGIFIPFVHFFYLVADKRLTLDLVHHITWLFPLHLINIQLFFHAKGFFLLPSHHSRRLQRGVHDLTLHHAWNKEKVNEDGNMKTFLHLDDDFSHFCPSFIWRHCIMKARIELSSKGAK